MRVRDERELADNERLAADVEKGAVEATLVVGEDPEAGDLRGTADRCVLGVTARDAEQHEQPRVAGADDLAVHAHGGPGDPLDDGAHGPILYARRVGVVELRDRDFIARFCRRRPAVHAYALGDLDDFFWPHTRWLAWEGADGLEQLVLLYDEPEPPVLLALAEPPAERMAELLEAIDGELPACVYAHLSHGLMGSLAPGLVPSSPPVAHRKLGLVDPTRLEGHGDGAVPLGPDDLDEVLAFYERAYPGTWFEPRMLETRRYVGIREAEGLVCVAGVHVWSPEWRVAALGNVATRPDARGRGLATAACADLCRRLFEDGVDVIALNVRADNRAAIHAYERLGFTQAADDLEVPLRRA